MSTKIIQLKRKIERERKKNTIKKLHQKRLPIKYNRLPNLIFEDIIYIYSL